MRDGMVPCGGCNEKLLSSYFVGDSNIETELMAKEATQKQNLEYINQLLQLNPAKNQRGPLQVRLPDLSSNEPLRPATLLTK